MKLIKRIFKFFMPGICPECKEKGFDRDEGTCSLCGYSEYEIRD